MQQLILHVGGTPTTVTELEYIRPPQATRTYAPVGHVDYLQAIRQRFSQQLGAEPLREGYGVARQGAQLFGVMTWAMEGEQHGLSVGLRNSYDRSMSCGLVAGASVFVCDNMAFNGDLRVLRRHTAGVWDDLREAMDDVATACVPQYRALAGDFEAMQAEACDDETAWAMLGILRGQDALAARQYEEALRHWAQPPHEEFGEPTMWRLYNAVTEALKTSPVDAVVERHRMAHRLLAAA